MNETQAEKVAEKAYDVPPEWRRRAYADAAKYREMYARSIADPNGFWGEEGKRIHWFKPYSKVKDTSFDPHNVAIKWFEDGTTNVAYNCLDRHLAKHGDRVAIIWEGDDPKDDAHITYRALHAEVRRTGARVNMKPGRDVYYDEVVRPASTECPCEEMNAEDPLFILYTSGSTGKPKGVLHTTGGYHVFVAMTHQYVFDYHDGDIYWCTADVGWVTGHSYIVYGPLANGATTLMFEGVPNYPSMSRFWEVVDKHKVNTFYTAPTAIRALMQAGEEPVKRTSRKSLRLLGTVGEPINPEAWEWYHRVVGERRCPIVDTWWQTETGGILITPLPGATRLKPGSATRPFFGVQPEIVDAEGKVLQGANSGNLVIADSWPGQMRTVYGDHERFVQL